MKRTESIASWAVWSQLLSYTAETRSTTVFERISNMARRQTRRLAYQSTFTVRERHVRSGTEYHALASRDVHGSEGPTAQPLG